MEQAELLCSHRRRPAPCLYRNPGVFGWGRGLIKKKTSVKYTWSVSKKKSFWRGTEEETSKDPGKMFSTFSPTPRIIIFTIFRRAIVGNGKSLDFRAKLNWVQFLTPLITSCVILGKPLKLSEPHFS